MPHATSPEAPGFEHRTPAYRKVYGYWRLTVHRHGKLAAVRPCDSEAEADWLRSQVTDPEAVVAVHRVSGTGDVAFVKGTSNA